MSHVFLPEMSGSPNCVNIQISKDEFQVVDIPFDSHILDLKFKLSQKIGLRPNDFELLFCGKILQADTSFRDLNLGQGSILHLYKGGRAGDQPLLSVKPKNSAGTKSYQYYVYCKPCSGLYPGKLRVRCADCKQGALLLHKEPCNWDDVLVPGRLQGHCNTCDKSTIAQFYFKCCEHDGEEEGSALRHIRPNRHNVQCVTCTQESSPVLVYPCKDKHVMCIDCFSSYARVSLDQRDFIEDPDVGYSLPCPVGCEDSLIHDNHHFRLLGNEQYERYKDFGAEECLLQSGGILCPNAGCGEGIMVEDDARNVTCRTCHMEFCRQCREEIHQGPCQLDTSAQNNTNVDSDRALRARWDAASIETIQETTKPCPHCAVKTEKSGGCMHMKCSRCRRDWCWVCEKEWTRVCQGDHWFG